MQQEASQTKQAKTFNPLQSVTGKFIIALGIILLIIAIIQIWYNTTTILEQVQLESELLLETNFEVYNTRVLAEARLGQALAISLANRADIRELYLAGDRDALYEYLRPMFEQMLELQVQHLYVHNPDGTVFLRVHNRDKLGDDVTYRPTLADSLNNKIITGGIDIGPNFIGTRAVAPMYDERNNFIGLLEIGIDYDSTFFSELKEVAGADFTAWITYEAAAAAGLGPAPGSPDAPISQLFFYSSTAPGLISIPSEVYTSVLQSGQAATDVYIGTDGAPYITYLVPFEGYQGKAIGLLEISEPYAQVEANLNAITLTNVAITLGLILVAIVIFSLFTSQVILRPLTELTKFVEAQAGGQLNARANVSSKDEFEQLANTFNGLSDSLQIERTTLSQRVADRTKDLATVAEVGTATATILEVDQLLQNVVELTKERFNLYHSHIYLLDEKGETLVLARGAGEVGRQMLEKGLSIPLDREQSLVARAARERQGVTVNDVTQAPDFLPNPLLPDTRSELAVPMIAGGNVIGVFDIQSDQVGRFGESDVNIQTTLAAQIATSLQNVRSFEQSRVQADFESLVNTIGQKIQRAATVEDTLQIAVRELGVALGASRVSANIAATRDDGDTAGIKEDIQ